MTGRARWTIWVLAAAAFAAWTGTAASGILGDPTGTIGRGSVSLGIEYDYVRGVTENDDAVGTDPAGEVEYRTQRYIARAGLGAFDWLDVYFRIGAADLGFPADSPGEPRFAGSTRFAMGGGLKARLFETGDPERLSARALLTTQALRFSSHGNIRFPVTGDTYKAFHNEYTWNEWDLGLVLAVTTPSVDSGGKVRLTPYVGVQKTFIDGSNDRTEYLIGPGARQAIGVERVDFADDGLPVRPVLGIEINMPQRYALGFEVTIIDSNEFSFGVSVSQASELRRKTVRERAADHKL